MNSAAYKRCLLTPALDLSLHPREAPLCIVLLTEEKIVGASNSAYISPDLS
jgi:hypothetical protein